MTRLADFKALSFDCYGTLIDWEAGILASASGLIARAGGAIGAEKALEDFARRESALEAAEPTLNYRKILAKTYLVLAQDWSVKVDPTEAKAFGDSVPDWPAFPDSTTALSYLKRHYKLIILSNIDRASFSASNRKLGVTFDLVCTAEDIGSYKPDARNFDFMLKRANETLGLGKADILHTAQSLFHDHRPAKQIGFSTAWIDRRQGKAGSGATMPVGFEIKTDFRFPSLAALVDRHRAEAAPRLD
jgi:2-haloacid dehalogenase